MTKFLLGLVTLFSAIIIGGIYLFTQSATPLYQARAETASYVQEEADIIQVNHFYMYNGAVDTYFTTDGFNQDGVRQIVIVRQSDGNIETYDFDDTVSEYDAYHQVQEDMNPQEIMKLNIGMDEQDRPVWEVSFKDENGRLGYYYLHLETGRNIRTITNL